MAVWLEPYLLRAMLLPLAFGWALEDTTLHLLYNKHCTYQYTGPGHQATGDQGARPQHDSLPCVLLLTCLPCCCSFTRTATTDGGGCGSCAGLPTPGSLTYRLALLADEAVGITDAAAITAA